MPDESPHAPAAQKEPDEYALLTPGVCEQVRGHLLLGPLVRRNIKLSTLGFILCFAFAALAAIRKNFTLMQLVIFLFGIPLHAIRNLSSLRQATCLWYALKGTGLMAGFLLSTAGALSTLMWHGTPTDAAVVLAVGLTIIPGPEFIPRWAPHQKWITAARLAVLLAASGYAFFTMQTEPRKEASGLIDNAAVPERR